MEIPKVDETERSVTAARRPADETLRKIIRRAVEEDGVPLPAIWKESVTALCERVIYRLIGER